jgi:hypothetical protein
MKNQNTFTLVSPDNHLETVDYIPSASFVKVIHWDFEKPKQYVISRGKARKWYAQALEKGWKKQNPNWRDVDHNRITEQLQYQLNLGL